MNRIKIIKSYIKDTMSMRIKFIIFMLIFYIVYSLYHLPLGMFLYSALIVITFGFFFDIYECNTYCKKHRKLKEVLDSIEYKLEDMPKSNSLIEKDYEDIINKIYENKKQLAFKLDDKYNNMKNYYMMWAHQIKTPISVFSMIVQTMENNPNKHLLEQELFKINEYVEMVLQYVRLDSLNSDLKLQKYSLTEIVKNSIKKYSSLFIFKRISLQLEDFDCYIISDKKWIAFVIEQILSNALKYTNKGSISIYMDKNSKETLVIEDTGIGISEEDVKQVFDRGFTGYNGRVDKKSTGIGLYLCKEIMERLSYKIYILSEQGKGTKVYLDFSMKSLKVE